MQEREHHDALARAASGHHGSRLHVGALDRERLGEGVGPIGEGPRRFFGAHPSAVLRDADGLDVVAALVDRSDEVAG